MASAVVYDHGRVGLTTKALRHEEELVVAWCRASICIFVLSVLVFASPDFFYFSGEALFGQFRLSWPKQVVG
jgi:hypothetical protein